MAIVTPTYRPERAPRKRRKQPEIAKRIVTPAPMKPRKGPVIRLSEQTPNAAADTVQAKPKRSAIVTVPPKRSTRFGPVPDLTEEEVLRRSDAADTLFREIVQRVAASKDE
jgi:hypothetical protein